MTIQPLLPLWAIVAGFVLLLVGLGWLEMRRPGRWLNARLAALVLVLLAIAGLLLQPAREKVEATAVVLLLTKDYEKILVDSLRDAHPDWEIFSTPDAAPYRKSHAIDDWVDLSKLGKQVGAIVGEGLPLFALEYFPEKHFQYFPSSLQVGFTDLKDKVYRKGQINQVEGHYFHAGTPVKLLLKGPSVMEDSLLIEEKGTQPFSLAFTPKAGGRWLYELQVKDSTGLIVDKQLLPIEVEEEPQLRLLILQAYPTFEVRYLKDFLADRGHAVAVRSQISRDKYRTEFANLPPRSLNRLDAGLFEDFDLLVTDGAAYDLLSRSELSILQTAIENGLGFLGLIDGDRPAFRRRLGLSNIASELDTTKLDLGISLPTYAVRLTSALEWYDIHTTADNQKTVAAYHYQGKGKVGFQSTQESYAFWLAGDSLTYAALWMPVLESTLREQYPEYTIDLLDDLPIFTGEPLDFRIIANQPLRAVYADSLQVPLQEDYLLDEVWYSRTWPSSEGWHTIGAGDEILAYYAFSKDSWPSLASAQKKKQLLINAGTGSSVTTANQETIVLQPISRLWFYVIFLLSAGFLWLAPKL